jgi:large subunit ribosomal protein L9
MQIILLEKIANLGDLGDKVNVKAGYGRNYLIPGGHALPATAVNVADFESRRAELELVASDKLTAAEARKSAVDGVTVTISRKAGEEGKLFGSVGTSDIAEALAATGSEIDRSEIRLPEGVFRAVGDYEVGVHLHTDVNATIVVSVVAEE